MIRLLQSQTLFLVPFITIGLYTIGFAIYRLYLSPLAKFPGPKLAALTRLYESYYEAIQNYEYLWKIKEMHEKYGMQLRTPSKAAEKYSISLE